MAEEMRDLEGRVVASDYLSYFNDKSVLITGGSGSIGSEIVAHLLLHSVCPRIVVFSRDESIQWEARQKFVKATDEADVTNRVRFVIGDVRYVLAISKALVDHDISIVIHTAAMKHVPVCEETPYEAAQTNILGTMNLVDACRMCNVNQLQLVSSDKAAEAISVMGMTKCLQERLVLTSGIKLVKAVRFGNVLGSRGSVVWTFKKQLEDNRQLTLTDPEMTRFIMTPREAAEFTLWSASKAPNKSISVKKMKSCSVKTLARAVVQNEHLDCVVIGKRPGEKNDEVLFSKQEYLRLSRHESDIGVVGIVHSEQLRQSEAIGHAIAKEFEHIATTIGYEEVSIMLKEAGVI